MKTRSRRSGRRSQQFGVTLAAVALLVGLYLGTHPNRLPYVVRLVESLLVFMP